MSAWLPSRPLPCVNIRTAECGCRVFYEFDPAEPMDVRLHRAIDPASDREATRRWNVGPAELVRLACPDHAGADHHEHFHNLLRDDVARPLIGEDAVRRTVEVQPCGGVRQPIAKD